MMHPRKKIRERILPNFLLGMLFVFVGINEWAWAQTDQDLNRILSQLKNRFASAKSFQAEYIRDVIPKVPSALPPSSLQAEGQIYFQSPNKLRMDQKKPHPQKLICNGVKVWWYQPEDKTVNVYLLKDYYLQIKPIIEFLSGLGGLEKDFSVRLEPAPSNEVPYYQLVLKPKTPQPELKQITVRVSKTPLLIQEFTYDNLLGDKTRFRLSKVQTGISLAPSWFEFTPPAGTRVESQFLSSPPRK
jgi:chaperone LolA